RPEVGGERVAPLIRRNAFEHQLATLPPQRLAERHRISRTAVAARAAFAARTAIAAVAAAARGADLTAHADVRRGVEVLTGDRRQLVETQRLPRRVDVLSPGTVDVEGHAGGRRIAARLRPHRGALGLGRPA